MAEHLKDHETKIPHPCESCDKTFVNVYTWHRHGFKIHGKKLECEECNKKFQNVDNFTWHLRYVHAEKTHACTQCPYSTSIRAKLRRHVERTHMKQFVARCDICSKGFLDKFYLEEHKNLHSGDTPNQCELCGKSFRFKTTLRAHKLKFHADIFPYVCRTCKKGFATKSGLESHTLAHTESKVFICDFCGKNLTTPATLTEHRRIHTGEFPFVCDICKKGFRAKKHLSRHMATHYDGKTDKKNHVCVHCRKKFSDATTCVSHTQKCQENNLERTTDNS